jgi:rhomboid protease GluP
MGVLLQVVWQRGEPQPAFGNIAAAVGATGFLIALLSFFLAAQPGNAAVAAAAASGLIPEDQLPRALDLGSDGARALLARYPHDPRAHLFRGVSFLKDDRDLADAEEQFRQALATKNLLSAQLSPDFEKTVTLLLALTIAYENRPGEARALGNPLCDYAEMGLRSLYADLRDKQICD